MKSKQNLIYLIAKYLKLIDQKIFQIIESSLKIKFLLLYFKNFLILKNKIF